MSCCYSIRFNRFNRAGRGLLALLMLALIAGCASRAPVPLSDSVALERMWAARHAQLSELDSWEMGGRIAVKSAQDSWSASLRWQQQAEAFDISFSSLLGQRIAQLKGDALTASLYLPDDQVRSAANISDLLNDELGWYVPLDGLRYWLVGLPAPLLELDKGLDQLGRLQWLEQAGWRIEYQHYRPAGVLEVPKKMVLTRDDLRVRLVIDRWRTVEPQTAKDVATLGLLSLDREH